MIKKQFILLLILIFSISSVALADDLWGVWAAHGPPFPGGGGGTLWDDGSNGGPALGSYTVHWPNAVLHFTAHSWYEIDEDSIMTCSAYEVISGTDPNLSLTCDNNTKYELEFTIEEPWWVSPGGNMIKVKKFD